MAWYGSAVLRGTSLLGESALYRLGEIRKKFVGQFLGCTVDQPLPELGELATDLRLDIVGQQRTAVLVGQPHGRAALGEAGDTALTFARYLVAVGRIEIAQRHAPLEPGRHRLARRRKLDLAVHCHGHRGCLPDCAWSGPQIKHAGPKRKGMMRP